MAATASYSLLTGDYGSEPNVLYSIKRKIPSAQDSLKPCIFRKPSPMAIVHRKSFAPKLLCPKLFCQSAGSLDDYDDRDSSKILVSPSLVDGLIPSTPLVDNANSVSTDIKNKIARKVLELRKVTGSVPVLGIVFVGQPQLKAFVEKLIGACCETGIKYVLSELPENHSNEHLIYALKDFNKDSSIHGIHVQIMDEVHTMHKVKLDKDIDGFQNQNFFDLVTEGREPNFLPPSPKGIVEFLFRSVMDLKEQHIVVVGRGINAFQMCSLLKRHHISTGLLDPLKENMDIVVKISRIQAIKRADVVIVESDLADLLPQRWLKPGAIVLDVGRCPVQNSVSEDMTIAMILFNTLDAASQQMFH